MKSKLILALTSLLSISFSLSMNAQISVGIKGSFVKAWEEYGDVFVPPGGDINIEGGQVSLLGYKAIGKYFQVGIEPGLVRRGAACRPGFIGFVGDSRILYNYVELPLMLAAKFPILKNKMTIFGKCGYGVSYALNANLKTELSDDSVIDFEEETNLRRWDTGAYASVGFGINMLLGGEIFLEGTYYHALIDADDLFVSQNRSIAIGIGYLRAINFK